LVSTVEVSLPVMPPTGGRKAGLNRGTYSQISPSSQRYDAKAVPFLPAGLTPRSFIKIEIQIVSFPRFFKMGRGFPVDLPAVYF